jgi:hypothetical protein
MQSESLKSFKGMVTEGSQKAIPKDNCYRMKNMICLENKFLSRAGCKKYNSVQYDGRINLIYNFKRVVGGNLKILAFGGNLAVGTPTYTSAPSANAGADQSKNSGDTVTLDGSASARAVSYLWTQTSGTTVTLSSTTAVSPTFTMPAGDVAFQLQVTNFWGNDTDTVDITEAFAGTLIHNCVELQAMQNDLAGNYRLANDIDCTYCTQDPAGALYNGGAGFEPVGTFTGKFDGNGHTITGLFINRPSTSYVGLFGYTGGSEIKNVGMIDVDITGAGGETGGLIAHNRDGSTATNCYSTGIVNGGGGNVGGLIGKNYGSTITKCYSLCIISSSGNVGGLIGYNHNSTAINCYSTGAVSGGNQSGGLIGKNRSSIVTNCYSTGAVSGSPNVGGLIGSDTSGTFNDDFWDTQTSGQATSAGGTGKTTAQMKQELTFSNWNFSTIWDITEGVTYPWLR